MKLSRRTALTIVSLALLLVAGVFLIKLRAAPQVDAAATNVNTTDPPVATESAAERESATSAATPAAAPAEARFEVPPGSVAEKLAFLNQLTRPATVFTSTEQANAYWAQAAAAMKTGADQVLNAQPTDAQASQAVQFKAEALRILSTLGDEDADRQRTEFLNTMLQDPRRDVSSVVGPLRLIPKLRRWQQLNAEQRTAAINEFVADVKAAGPTPGQAEVLLTFADARSDSPDRGQAARALDQLLPTFRDSKNPTIAKMVPTLEGLRRRLHLPGNKLELEGTLIAGQPLDWDAYRGKVVLVDFWASWCGECLKEVPNIVANYREFHDRGFEVIGVCLDNDRSLAEQTIRRYGMSWPQLFSAKPHGNGWTHPLAEKYAIMGIPRAILVDQQGNVVTMLARGPMLHAYLEKLLGPPDRAEDAQRARPDTSKSGPARPATES